MTRGARALLGSTLAGLLLLAGCGDKGTSSAPAAHHDPEREHAVAADPHATADEIIDEGQAVRVAETADQTLVAYRPESDDDEGPQQAAWRLYDDGERRVADGRLGLVREQSAIPELTAVGDGFLVESYTGHLLRRVSPAGVISGVPTVRRASPARAGDVLLEGYGDTGGRSVYRPADHAAYTLPRLPTANPQGMVVDHRGTVWVLLDWRGRSVGVLSSPGGTGPWRRTTVPLQRDGFPEGIAVAGDRVVVPTAHGKGEVPGLDGIWAYPDDDMRAGWTRTAPTGIDLDRSIGVSVDALADGRLLVVGDGGAVFLQEAADRPAFTEVGLPRGSRGASVQVSGDALFATFTRDHQLYRSKDAGDSWQVVRR